MWPGRVYISQSAQCRREQIRGRNLPLRNQIHDLRIRAVEVLLFVGPSEVAEQVVVSNHPHAVVTARVPNHASSGARERFPFLTEIGPDHDDAGLGPVETEISRFPFATDPHHQQEPATLCGIKLRNQPPLDFLYLIPHIPYLPSTLCYLFSLQTAKSRVTSLH